MATAMPRCSTTAMFPPKFLARTLPKHNQMVVMLRALTLLLCLASPSAWAEATERNDEVSRWFAHCAAFDSTDFEINSLAIMNCVDKSMKLCRLVDEQTPGSACFDRLEASARAEVATLIPVLQAIEPATERGRGAIQRDVQRLSSPPITGDCHEDIAPMECAAFTALVDWSYLRLVILDRSR